MLLLHTQSQGQSPSPHYFLRDRSLLNKEEEEEEEEKNSPTAAAAAEFP